jgi:hypothetical protein
MDITIALNVANVGKRMTQPTMLFALIAIQSWKLTHPNSVASGFKTTL